jgi:hypothetical protein
MRGGSNYPPRFQSELRLADYPHIQVSTTLSAILKVQDAHSDELYEAMDALSERQQEIEQSLA